jgi:hypothetical protein
MTRDLFRYKIAKRIRSQTRGRLYYAMLNPLGGCLVQDSMIDTIKMKTFIPSLPYRDIVRQISDELDLIEPARNY